MWHLLCLFHKLQPTMISDHPSALDCHVWHSPGTGFFSWTTTHHLSGRMITLSSGYLGFPTFCLCKAASCFTSGSFFHQILPVAGRTVHSSVFLTAVTPQPESTTEQRKAEARWTKGVNADALQGLHLAIDQISLFAVSSSDIMVCIPN